MYKSIYNITSLRNFSLVKKQTKYYAIYIFSDTIGSVLS